MTDLSDPLVIATAVLALATIVLAWFTGLLWRIERRRAATESRRRRYARVARKLQLAEEILKEDRPRFFPGGIEKSGSRSGYSSRAQLNMIPQPATWLRQFARLIDPVDGIPPQSLNALLVVLDSMSKEGTWISEEDMETKFFIPLKELKEIIHSGPKGEGEKHSLLRKWRGEMDALAAAEEVPPGLE